jgi:hypothetical protein
MRLGSTNLSHSVTSVLNVKGTVLRNSVLAAPSLCVTGGPQLNLDFEIWVLQIYFLFHFPNILIHISKGKFIKAPVPAAARSKA